MNIRRYTNKFKELDINYLINSLRSDKGFYGKLSIVIGDNGKKNFKGDALPNHIYINAAKINNLNDFIETIIHEFIHVCQFASGDLSHDENGELLWKGEFQQRWIDNPTAAPWEIDAYFETIRLS